VLEELASRDGLDIAFAGRDEANLEPVLHFLCKYVADPRFAGAMYNPLVIQPLATHDVQACSLTSATRCSTCTSGSTLHTHP